MFNNFYINIFYNFDHVFLLMNFFNKITSCKINNINGKTILKLKKNLFVLERGNKVRQ